ncbi:MAG: hypothetical protein QW290_09320 [Sulfolobales archaeon]
MTNVKKILVCPLLSLKSTMVVCLKEGCAWYDETMAMCAVQKIALALYDVAVYGVKHIEVGQKGTLLPGRSEFP